MIGLNKYNHFKENIQGFTKNHVFASGIEKEECLSRSLVKLLGQNRLLGANIDQTLNEMHRGILHAELAKGHASVQNFVTVSEMVIEAINRFGKNDYFKALLPELLNGNSICSFALSEPNAGSDIRGIETRAEKINDYQFVLNGKKKWISFAQIADKHLIFTKSALGSAAFLIDATSPGVSITPINGLLGLKANSLAQIELKNVLVNNEQMLGNDGAGLSQIANFSLNRGRYSTSWGCIGIAELCFEEVQQYVWQRRQFGKVLAEHQLIQKIISEISVELMSAKLLCINAGTLLMNKDPNFLVSLLMAKYKASTMVNMVASKAVQVLAAEGVTSESKVQRCFRDAKIMEIIEGTSQLFEIYIARNIRQNFFDEATFGATYT